MTFSTSGNFLPETIDIPDQQKDLTPYLKTRLEEIIRLLNRKDTGTYDLAELQNNQQFFGANPQVKRFAFRKVITTGALLNAAPTAVNHNLNNGAAVPATWLFTRIYGFARSLTPEWIPLPNGGIRDCAVQVTATQVIITPTVDLSAFTESWVVLEYLKN